jgi:hypothetical protein
MSPIATDRILMTPCRFWGNADIEQFSARNNLPDSTLTGNLAATPNGDIGSDQQPLRSKMVGGRRARFDLAQLRLLPSERYCFVETFPCKGAGPRESRWNYSMPDLIQTGNSSKRRSKASIDAAPAAEPRDRFDAALKAIGLQKSKAELDAEEEAEARLKKALSQFGSRE